ncbi:MAG: metal ABC transporter substrate-binding protein [Dehalococcoidia bacterium]
MSAFFWRTLRLGISVAVCAVTLGLIACGGDDDGGKPKVVATLPLFADMAANVAGDRAEVEALLPTGADPHTYEPSPSDVRKVAEADVIFANGFSLEPAALRVIGANIASDAVLVELGEATVGAGAETIEDEEEAGEANPHLWMDVANAREYARIIRDTLVDRDPGGEADYNANYQTYVALLDSTQAYLNETVASVPEGNRRIIATHDAFVYLARAIDFEVAGFVAPSPGQEPSPEDIRSLIATIQEFNIPAVFSEPQTDAETATLEQIASDAGVEVCTLYSDAFDETVTTYVDLMRYDAEELARCLGGAGG